MRCTSGPNTGHANAFRSVRGRVTPSPGGGAAMKPVAHPDAAAFPPHAPKLQATLLAMGTPPAARFVTTAVVQSFSVAGPCTGVLRSENQTRAGLPRTIVQGVS
jgi:hypothetical protein